HARVLGAHAADVDLGAGPAPRRIGTAPLRHPQRERYARLGGDVLRSRTGMKPLASLSLDLDNLWSYQMTHGDDGWDEYDSYLGTLVPIVLDLLTEHRLRITFFVVGQDAALDRNDKPIRALAEAGHEIGNHSFRHQPWLHRYTPAEIDGELARAEHAIET